MLLEDLNAFSCECVDKALLGEEGGRQRGSEGGEDK